MNRDDMPAVAYRILRYMDACQKRGVCPDEGRAREAAGVIWPYFATVMRALIEAGLVEPLFEECWTMNDGEFAVTTVFTRPRLTLSGSKYLCENGTMAKARALMGDGFEEAVEALAGAATA